MDRDPTFHAPVGTAIDRTIVIERTGCPRRKVDRERIVLGQRKHNPEVRNGKAVIAILRENLQLHHFVLTRRDRGGIKGRGRDIQLNDPHCRNRSNGDSGNRRRRNDPRTKLISKRRGGNIARRGR